MIKLLIGMVLILINLFIPYNVYALSTTEANGKIDVERDCSIILNYNYSDYKFDNINVEIYYVASVTSDFKYQLSSNFSKYPVKINGLTTVLEWTILEDTLNSYIMADGIKATNSYSKQGNVMEITDLNPGLYFIKTDKISTPNYTLLFDSFLISVPNLDEKGDWYYDVNVYPKAEEYIPKYEKITYTVIKEWIDDKENRPKNVDIEIYKDGLLIDSQVLSVDNNWMYKWQAEDSGSEWSVIERNISSGYNVSILNEDNKFIIVNTDSSYKSENPKTLDDIKLYLYLFIGSLVGIVLLTIGLIMKRRG